MRAGANYRIEFFVKSFHEIYDSLGVIFTASDPLFDKEPLHFKKPSIFLSSKYDPLGFRDSLWYKIELDYTANGEERFFSFGYFARENYFGERAHPLENRFFVFFDDVAIYPQDPNELPCRNYRERKEEIYDENERHTLLEKKIAHYKRNPPPPPTVLRNEFIRIDTLVLPDILFASGKAKLEPGSYTTLDSFILKINSTNVDSIVIEGHTDSIGSFSFNEQLSLARANAVKNYLSVRSGVSSIFTRGLAFLRPVAENKTPAGRQKNRRVEVLLYIRD
jgi:outer membrane protein OmpA-like peptidoglycan-associated protein